MIEYNEAVHGHLNTLSTVSKKNVEILLSHFKIMKFKAKAPIVDFGEKPEYIYMLINGVVRSFMLLESGKEVTKTLFAPIDLFSSLTSLLTQKPSEFCYQALTDCEVFAINFLKFKELSNDNIEILQLYVGYLEYVFKINEQKHLEVLSKDSKDRYLALRERIPDIDNLIPQYQIAGYLNITPVQLSRIRSDLKKKN